MNLKDIVIQKIKSLIYSFDIYVNIRLIIYYFLLYCKKITFLFFLFILLEDKIFWKLSNIFLNNNHFLLCNLNTLTIFSIYVTI